jgi:Xaa-Pro aminopeptidase
MLTMEGCRTRQRRLLAAMERERWDFFLTGNYRTVYYLTGCLSPPETPAIFLLSQDAGSVLVTSTKGGAAADEIIPLETYSIQRSITHPGHDAAALLKNYLAGKPHWRRGTGAAEPATTPVVVQDAMEAASPGIAWADATNTILASRKRKEADEIEEIRTSLRYCAVAYRAAKQAIAPGRTELDVYNAMFAAIVQEAGTTVPFPGDFACGTRGIKEGGPPTRRRIQSGDLYILDLFPAPALYFGDTCRTFSVGPPTDLQSRAWEIVLQAVHLGEGMVKPGVRARDVYQAVKDFLDSHEITQKSFWHHAGHGIGHHGHEAPRIIPGTDDLFEVGDVITLDRVFMPRRCRAASGWRITT